MTDVKEALLGDNAVGFKLKVELDPDYYANYMNVLKREYLITNEPVFDTYYFAIKINYNDVYIDVDDKKTLGNFKGIEFELPNMLLSNDIDRSLLWQYFKDLTSGMLTTETVAGDIVVTKIDTFVFQNTNKYLDWYHGVTIYASIQFIPCSRQINQ